MLDFRPPRWRRPASWSSRGPPSRLDPANRSPIVTSSRSEGWRSTRRCWKCGEGTPSSGSIATSSPTRRPPPGNLDGARVPCFRERADNMSRTSEARSPMPVTFTPPCWGSWSFGRLGAPLEVRSGPAASMPPRPAAARRCWRTGCNTSGPSEPASRAPPRSTARALAPLSPETGIPIVGAPA